MTVSLLSSLKVTARPENTSTNPLLKRRERLLTKLGIQNEMALALVNGERYIAYREKWQVNPDTKIREMILIPKNVKPWFYKRNNQYYLEVRYANKPLELQKGLAAIEVGELDNLVPTIETVIQAIVEGELDKLLVPIAPINKTHKASKTKSS